MSDSFWVSAVHGSSFLALAGVTALSLRRALRMKLTRGFWFLVVFGLLQGGKALCDLAPFYGRGARESCPPWLAGLSAVLLWTSFIALLEFALTVLTLRESGPDVFGFPFLLAGVLAAAFLSSGRLEPEFADTLGRIGLALPATVGTAAAFFILGRKVASLGRTDMAHGARLAAGAFFAYGVFVTTLSPEVAGLPVPLLRAACAVAVTVATAFFLHGFGTGAVPGKSPPETP